MWDETLKFPIMTNLRTWLHFVWSFLLVHVSKNFMVFILKVKMGVQYVHVISLASLLYIHADFLLTAVLYAESGIFYCTIWHPLQLDSNQLSLTKILNQIYCSISYLACLILMVNGFTGDVVLAHVLMSRDDIKALFMGMSMNIQEVLLIFGTKNIL